MNNILKDWRKQIDVIDEEMLTLIAKRIRIVRKIGEYKKVHGINPLDEKRWQLVLESKLSYAAILNLSKSFVKKLYNLIHKYSLEIEKEIK